ncbi:hypothetical protein [Clostridium algidicarnis]|nr:hypothetical protein [Clostridium algidicarnis]MBU3203967.1 hypothetical protein [Clostridium algidicarnis]MBU3212121.1 hypothetical protein [Clostridium algidicarnis]MBU3221374.1 hypothetical protein [Clostridium algidicarnis]
MTKQAEQLGQMVLKWDLTGDKSIEIIKDRYKSKITYGSARGRNKSWRF